MRIEIKKLTTIEDMRAACESTLDAKSKMTLEKIYKCMHSPIRTQLFWIQMYDIPTFVATHFVRHKMGTEHFVKSNRDDRGGEGNNIVTRETPVNHGMLLNAESLINMAYKRLCFQASKETREVMIAIRDAVKTVDPDLAFVMVPQCFSKNMYCQELKKCGRFVVKTSLKEEYEEFESFLINSKN